MVESTAELIQVEPLDGGWNDAVSYEITQNDQKRTRIYRRDLDDGAYEAIRTCFEMFSWSSRAISRRMSSHERAHTYLASRLACRRCPLDRIWPWIAVAWLF